MAKIILHPEGESLEAIAERRLLENAMRTPEERFDKIFEMMELAALFKKGPIKEPQGLGIVLKRKVA